MRKKANRKHERRKIKVRIPYPPACTPDYPARLPCSTSRDGREQPFSQNLALVRYLYKLDETGVGGIICLAAAVAGSGRYAVAWADLDVWLSVVRGGGSHALLDLPGHGQESLLDVAGVLGRGLEEWDAETVSKLLFIGLVKRTSD